MQTKIQKWGNSIGLRIPKIFAQDAGVEAGSTVDISVEDGDLVIRPVRRRRYALEALVAEITSNNIHEPAETGPPVGREAW